MQTQWRIWKKIKCPMKLEQEFKKKNKIWGKKIIIRQSSFPNISVIQTQEKKWRKKIMIKTIRENFPQLKISN